MTALIVVERPENWPLEIPGTEVVSATDYLTDSRFIELKRAKVFNLCRSYAYQSAGYYVSLLAAARGHKPLPSVTTMQDLRQSSLLRIASETTELLIQQTFASIKSDRFVLSIYFGRNMAKRYDRLCSALFNHFPAPFLRAEFVRADHWRLEKLEVIASHEIPESHRDFVIERAKRFFDRPRASGVKRARYDLAILVNPEEIDAPSDDKAIHKFLRAAKKASFDAWVIGKEDFGRIAEFDALFLRETTSVDHYTYRFARRAEAEGLVVIDDPESIVRCTNKVYQAELFAQNDIGCPETLVVYRESAEEVAAGLGLPCVLKKPDSSFSTGVVKASTEAELTAQLREFLRDSELVIAQEFVASDFDWRIGVLDRKPLFACRYHMARGHWQIQKAVGESRRSYGRAEALALEDAPQNVVDLAVRAANLVGDGLYGVDVKDVDGRLLVMEVNDNPNIEAGTEDAVLKEGLYLAIMQSFYDRLERRGRGERR
ncbi:MAG: RimK family protein [Myxococcales bacterium]|nr:RimK family protein [Myxococcales bacterium]MDH3483239.1 RimK family protein [Myxococcales bacterium]